MFYLAEGEVLLQEPLLLWMDEILHHLRSPGMIRFPCNYQQQMVSKWCETDFVHRMLTPGGHMGSVQALKSMMQVLQGRPGCSATELDWWSWI